MERLASPIGHRLNGPARRGEDVASLVVETLASRIAPDAAGASGVLLLGNVPPRVVDRLGAAGYAPSTSPNASPGPDGRDDAPVACIVALAEHESASSLLDESYRRLAPGGLLVTLEHAEVPRLGRDALSNALYVAGFARPRFRDASDGAVASALRSAAEPPLTRTQRVSVVMPVYNERRTFSQVIDQLLAQQIPGAELEVLIVESNSTDGTRDEVLSYSEHPRVRVILENRPEGKGHAVRTGLAAATGDIVMIQDADLEYDLDDYATVLAPLLTGEAAFVLGIRTRTDGARWGIRHFEAAALTSRIMNVGNIAFLALFNLVYRQRLHDPFTMYKVFRRDCMEGLSFESNRFDFDWELVAKLIRSGYAPVEVPVTYRSRSFAQGKKISVLRDPFTWVRACFKYRFQDLGD